VSVPNEVSIKQFVGEGVKTLVSRITAVRADYRRLDRLLIYRDTKAVTKSSNSSSFSSAALPIPSLAFCECRRLCCF